MAKQVGFNRITGSVHGLSYYYDSRNGYLVRQTGGVSSRHYHQDNRYQAARDASSEFSKVSKAGKLIREALGEFIDPVKDGTMVNRLNKVLVDLKQRDTVHAPGKRRPEVMMCDTEANQWLRIFQFNDAAKLYEIMSDYPSVDPGGKRLSMTGCAISFPGGATHATITAVRTLIDFERGCFETAASHMQLISSETSPYKALEIPAVSMQTGIELICLQVLFFREENGDLVQLTERVHAMGVVKVGCLV